MKKLLFLCCFLPSVVIAQIDSIKYFKDTIPYTPMPVDSNGVITYKMIEEVPNISKKDLYSRAKVWTAIAFRSTKNVIQFDDEDRNGLIVKGVQEGDKSALRFYIRFTFKDNKYRVIIAQFVIEQEELPSHSFSANSSVPIPVVNYYPDDEYKAIVEFNNNGKTGNMEYNRQHGLGKRAAREYLYRLNWVSDFTHKTMAEIKKNMLISVKGDDF